MNTTTETNEPTTEAGVAESGPRLVLVDGAAYPLRSLLRGSIPKALILAEAGSVIAASRFAKELRDGKAHGPWLLPAGHARLGQAGGAMKRVLVLDRDDPANPATTKLYDQAWRGRSYEYRVPCGDWKHCENPDGPIMAHYSAPSKNEGSQEPHLCQHCRRRKGPSERNREITRERNRSLKGTKRGDRRPE